MTFMFIYVYVMVTMATISFSFVLDGLTIVLKFVTSYVKVSPIVGSEGIGNHWYIQVNEK